MANLKPIVRIAGQLQRSASVTFQRPSPACAVHVVGLMVIYTYYMCVREHTLAVLLPTHMHTTQPLSALYKILCTIIKRLYTSCKRREASLQVLCCHYSITHFNLYTTFLTYTSNRFNNILTRLNYVVICLTLSNVKTNEFTYPHSK